MNASQQKMGKGNPNTQTKVQSKDHQPLSNPSKLQENKGTRKMKKDTRRWCEFHKIPWHKTDEYYTKKSLLAKLKALESELGFNSDLDLDKGNQIIEDEPSFTVATTQIQLNEPEDPKEGEFLFHLQMWVKGTPLHFIFDNRSQNNLISRDTIKQLKLLTTLHPQPYNIGWISP